MNKNIYLLLVTMLLSSCASTPMLSDYDVRKAENHNQLQDLYGEIEETLAQKKIKSDVQQNRQQYQVIVSRKIAEQKERELLAALDHDVKNMILRVCNRRLMKARPLKAITEKSICSLL